MVTPVLATATGGDVTSPPIKFSGGLLAGSFCGLATQLFHNTALTAGRVVETGGSCGTVEAMQRVFAEHGARAIYVNFQFRVAVIALWTAILNVADPFRKEARS